MRTTWNFYTPGQLLFGQNAIQQLGDIAKQRRVRRAFLVTDPILIKAGVAGKAQEPLQKAGVVLETFTAGEPEPSMKTVLACAAQAKAFQPDVLIGLGGGSNMDLTKAAATVMVHGGHPRDYAGDGKVPGPVAPIWCIPTTSGTGSEISFASVLNDEDAGYKVGVLSNWLRPKLALVDPVLTTSCPPSVTADSGIDALTHAIEAYTAVDNREFPLPAGETTCYQGRHPIADAMAEKAISLVGKYLRRAVADGSDMEAREGMALGATTAGMAFSNVGVALVHALEYAVGAATKMPHGRGNGLLLPYVMRFNKTAALAQIAKIAALLGVNTSQLSQEDAAERAIEAVEKLRADVGIPSRLRDVGMSEDQLPPLAEKTFGIKRILRVNPRSATAADLEGILRSAY